MNRSHFPPGGLYTPATPPPPPNPPHFHFPPPPPLPQPPADLPSAISHLRSLLSLASSTLSSLPRSPSPLLPCPHNPHHFVPPESLYNHFLHCPTPLPSSFPSFIPPPKTEPELDRNQAGFTPASSDSDADADFVFSLESEVGERGLGFFYRECPGVVSSVPESAKSFALPGFLVSECGGALTAGENEMVDGKFGAILPSEYWVLKGEVEAWGSFPGSYSYTALRAILGGFTAVPEEDLKRWIISNSPKHGVVIDVAMRDHIWVLLKVCLKAVRREALSSLDAFSRDDGVLNPKFTISCPKLSRSFAWLSTQLSILYGEVYATSFALGMVKEAIVRSGFCILASNFGEGGGEVHESKSREVAIRGSCNGIVFVSQVASAIGALYQRAFLEENFRALRSTQPVYKPHLLMEYANLSSRAADERLKRPNYRPVVDYDSLPSNRVQNQESGRAKTKEELLAEERDYKRRRTSYRGKKVKRSPTEVLRDIIKEQMEVIKQAGWIVSDQTSTEHASSRTDNSQKPIASDNSFHSSPSRSHDKSYIRASRYERENDADRCYSMSYGHDDWNRDKKRRRDDVDHYALSYSEHEDRYRSKERKRENHNRRSESVVQDTFDDRYDTYRDREEKRKHHRYDRSR